MVNQWSKDYLFIFQGHKEYNRILLWVILKVCIIITKRHEGATIIS